jgi:hypothetical protein
LEDGQPTPQPGHCRVVLARADDSGAMRPEYDDSGVFPGSILAQVWRNSIVNRNYRYSRVSKILPASVVAIR